MPAPLLVIAGLVLKTSGMYARALPRKRRKVVFTNLSSMTSHSGSNTHRLNRAYASLKVRTSITLGEIDILNTVKSNWRRWGVSTNSTKTSSRKGSGVSSGVLLRLPVVRPCAWRCRSAKLR